MGYEKRVKKKVERLHTTEVWKEYGAKVTGLFVQPFHGWFIYACI